MHDLQAEPVPHVAQTLLCEAGSVKHTGSRTVQQHCPPQGDAQVHCSVASHVSGRAAEPLTAAALNLITAGGSAGIGRAVALGLSDNGAIVTVLARRKDRLDAVVKQLHKVILTFATTAGL